MSDRDESYEVVLSNFILHYGEIKGRVIFEAWENKIRGQTRATIGGIREVELAEMGYNAYDFDRDILHANVSCDIRNIVFAPSGISGMGIGTRDYILSGPDNVYPSRDPAAEAEYRTRREEYQKHAAEINRQFAEQVAEKEEINRKAWLYLEETAGKEDYLTLIAGKTLEIPTCLGITFGVNCRGEIYYQKSTKIFKSNIEKSGQLRSGNLPMGDLVAAFIQWVKNNPQDLLDKWACGNITINDLTK